MTRVRSGLEVLLDDGASSLRGKRVALCCNHTAIDARLQHAIEGLQAAGVQLVRLFAPEHGVRATAQDMIGMDEDRDPVSGLPVVSLYGHDEASLIPKPEHLRDLDAVVFDIADVGARYYTYQATLGYIMQVAGPLGVEVVVLDRPNPITGTRVEGNAVQPGFSSFVGAWPLAARHGMTMGELAQWFRGALGIEAPLTVVRCDGWRRGMWWEDTGLPWVYPSPNMPTVETATLYPGMCLFEATTLSEGRGTTRPFHHFGAPGLDPYALMRECERLAADAGLVGVGFRPTAFEPRFQKHAGVGCTGAEVHVLDRDRLDAWTLGLVCLEAAYRADADRFGWRPDPYEFISDRPAVDLLAGWAGVRDALESGTPLSSLAATHLAQRATFDAQRAAALIYPE